MNYKDYKDLPIYLDNHLTVGKKINKTKINNVKDLKVNDVIYVYEKQSKETNKTLPECNFHRITVVNKTRQLIDGTYVYDSIQFHKLTSENGDSAVVYDKLKNHIVLPGGKFGCNHRIDESIEVYRLDSIYNFKPTLESLRSEALSPSDFINTISDERWDNENKHPL
jgi:hypothetical protein